MNGTAESMSGKPELAGQTVVVIDGGSGIGLEIARRARAEGASAVAALNSKSNVGDAKWPNRSTTVAAASWEPRS